MISGTLCGGESLEDIGLFAVTILVTIAAIFTLGADVYFIWCGFLTLIRVGMLGKELTNLQWAILILCTIGMACADMSIAELGEDFGKYLNNPNKENAKKILGRTVEMGILLFLFE